MTFSAAEFDERYRNITLRLTCSTCPEQYDAFIGDRKVGYLRLRWGEFRVDYPDCGGEMIYATSSVIRCRAPSIATRSGLITSSSPRRQSGNGSRGPAWLRLERSYLSSQTSSMRQPLKMLLTMTVHPLTWGCQQVARRS
jgi:hypothetical protein